MIKLLMVKAGLLMIQVVDGQGKATDDQVVDGQGRATDDQVAIVKRVAKLMHVVGYVT